MEIITTNRCQCKKSKPIKIHDEFNTVSCQKCFEVISYEKKTLAEKKTVKKEYNVDMLMRHEEIGYNRCIRDLQNMLDGLKRISASNANS